MGGSNVKFTPFTTRAMYLFGIGSEDIFDFIYN